MPTVKPVIAHLLLETQTQKVEFLLLSSNHQEINPHWKLPTFKPSVFRIEGSVAYSTQIESLVRPDVLHRREVNKSEASV